MRVAVLGSGSAGNAVLVCAGETRILVDAGFSGRSLEERLGVLDDPSGLDRRDRGHARPPGPHARHGRLRAPSRHPAPHDAAHAGGVCRSAPRRTSAWSSTSAGRPFQVGESPRRAVPHRARRRRPRGRRRGRRAHRAAGSASPPTSAARPPRSGTRSRAATCSCSRPTTTSSCSTPDPYPASVKRRIASSHGHLSNQAAARLALELLHPRLAGVVLAHLSVECNRPRPRGAGGRGRASEGGLAGAHRGRPPGPPDGAAGRRGAPLPDRPEPAHAALKEGKGGLRPHPQQPQKVVPQRPDHDPDDDEEADVAPRQPLLHGQPVGRRARPR